MSEPASALRIALPKGRMLSKLQGSLQRIGLAVPEDLNQSRRLIVACEGGAQRLGFDVEVLLLKNADVPVYVEHGVAEVGVSGTDLLVETGISLFRPYTFPYGRCDVVLAARKDRTLDDLRQLPLVRVATKYTRFAREHFAQLGWTVEIIPLSGSVELAPVLGLADCIVDLSDTGRTLIDNGLAPLQVIGRTSLKLVANRALGRRTTSRVESLVRALRSAEGEPSDV